MEKIKKSSRKTERFPLSGVYHNESASEYIIDQLDQQAFDEALSRLLEKMPPESRLLFSLRFEEELTIPQIAVVMAIAEGTVKSRLHILTLLKLDIH